jgi:hypothetical protein
MLSRRRPPENCHADPSARLVPDGDQARSSVWAANSWPGRIRRRLESCAGCRSLYRSPQCANSSSSSPSPNMREFRTECYHVRGAHRSLDGCPSANAPTVQPPRPRRSITTAASCFVVSFRCGSRPEQESIAHAPRASGGARLRGDRDRYADPSRDTAPQEAEHCVVGRGQNQQRLGRCADCRSPEKCGGREVIRAGRDCAPTDDLSDPQLAREAAAVASLVRG